MDDLDRAKELEQQQRDFALKAAQNRDAQPPQLRDDNNNIICIDCEEPIPKKRLDAKPDAARCIYCKTALEKQQKNFRR